MKRLSYSWNLAIDEDNSFFWAPKFQLPLLNSDHLLSLKHGMMDAVLLFRDMGAIGTLLGRRYGEDAIV